MVVKDPRNHRHFEPAPAGSVWLLTRTEWRAGPTNCFVSAKPYVDPFQAIADLAVHVRAHWASRKVANSSTIPALAKPPADDFEAVAAYYLAPEKLTVHETYNLDLVDVDATRVERAGQEHVLIRTYGPFVCVCGNVPEIDGFILCTEDGTDYDSGEFYRCCTCARIIANDGTGRVVGRYAEPHRNEPSMVDAARTASTALANLLEVWESATQGPDGDEVESALSVNYPFNEELAEVVARFANWTHQVRATVEGNPADIAAAVEHMRTDVDSIRTHMIHSDYHGHNNSNSTFQQGMRGGLGGAIGDFGAAFHPGVAELLAELLDAIATGSATSAIRRRAALLCQVYEEARADNRDL